MKPRILVTSAARGHPMLAEPLLAHDNKEWLVPAKEQRIAVHIHAPTDVHAHVGGAGVPSHG